MSRHGRSCCGACRKSENWEMWSGSKSLRAWATLWPEKVHTHANYFNLLDCLGGRVANFASLALQGAWSGTGMLWCSRHFMYSAISHGKVWVSSASCLGSCSVHVCLCQAKVLVCFHGDGFKGNICLYPAESVLNFASIITKLLWEIKK